MTTFTRLLPNSTRTPILRKAALTAAGLAFTGGAIAGPITLATAAHAEPTTTGTVTAAMVTTDHGNGNGKGADTGKPAAEKELHIDYQAQPNFYYCGPASTRLALTAIGQHPDIDSLAHDLGTTQAGTNSAEDITRVLNAHTGGKYTTTAIPSADVTPAQMDQLQTDVKKTIDDNRALVANIAGTTTDTDGMTHSYEGGHYIAVDGYRDDGRQAHIADPANPNTASYWVSTINLANWMATHGYSH